MATALFTLEEYKTYASINSPSQDDHINLLLPAVFSAIETFLGYSFDEPPVGIESRSATLLTSPYQQEYLLNDVGSNITAISLELIPSPGSSIVTENTTEALDESEWFAEADIGKVTILRSMGRTRYRMLIAYEYDQIEASADIKLAGMMLLDYWRDKKNFNKSVVSQGQSTTKIAMSNLPKHIEAVLNMYRKL